MNQSEVSIDDVDQSEVSIHDVDQSEVSIHAMDQSEVSIHNVDQSEVICPLVSWVDPHWYYLLAASRSSCYVLYILDTTLSG